MREGYGLSEVVVSPDGVVLAITEQNDFDARRDKHYHILSKGRQTGEINIDTDIETSRIFPRSFQVINDKIFALSNKIHTEKIYVWNHKGAETIYFAALVIKK
jgi:hypothetical protein